MSNFNSDQRIDQTWYININTKYKHDRCASFCPFQVFARLFIDYETMTPDITNLKAKVSAVIEYFAGKTIDETFYS